MVDSIDRAQISNIADMIEFIETVEKRKCPNDKNA